jgi:poly-beta-1,6-N-acetyl-D-glucosamine synthase
MARNSSREGPDTALERYGAEQPMPPRPGQVDTDPAQVAYLVEEQEQVGRDAQGRIVRQHGPIERVAFNPIRRRDDHYKTENSRTYLKRIFVYGLLSLIFAAIIYVFVTNYQNIPYRISQGLDGAGPGRPFTLGFNGLLVYSSIVALILFLVLLLVRYFGLLLLSYLHTARYTAKTEEASGFLPKVSIIVPAYNEGVLMRQTIQSLLLQEYPDYEVIVVDDGSKDDTGAIAREMVGLYETPGRRVEVKLVEKPNGGKSTALNAGIQVASGEFVLNVDGDSQLSPQTLRRMIRHFSDAKVGAVAGNVKVINRNNLWTKLQALEYVEGLNMARSAQSMVKLVNIIPGPVGLFRKSAIIEAGWYSSDTYAEDCDITLKIIREGWKVEYEPDAISYTEAPAKLNDLLKQRYRWTRGIIQAVRKHRDLIGNPTINFGGTFVMWYMAFESLIWPIMNVFANAYFVTIAVMYGYYGLLAFWWLILTILDIIAALYCVAVEKEQASLVLYSVFYRLFFILIIDVCKTFATIEEFLGLGMTWGKLERIGAANRSASPVPA